MAHGRPRRLINRRAWTWRPARGTAGWIRTRGAALDRCGVGVQPCRPTRLGYQRMKPAPFQYVRPRTVEDALALMAEAEGEFVKVIAGGQSLVPLMNLRMASPDRLIDLQEIASLRDLRFVDDSLRIGAMVTQRECELSTLVGAHVPLLTMALPLVAHPPVRERGTIGGSLVHADPAAELPLVAIMTEATLLLRSLTGQRRVSAADFVRGALTTDLGQGELLLAVELPTTCPRAGWGFSEFSQRHGDFAWALTAAQVCIRPDGTLSLVVLGLGGICSPPVRHPFDELRSKTPELGAFTVAAEELLSTIEVSPGGKAQNSDLRAITLELAVQAFENALEQANNRKEVQEPCTCR